MGFLNEAGAALGQMFSPGASAAANASSSLGWGTLSTGVNVAANVAAGLGGLQQANFAAKVAGQNEQAALLAGQSAESASRMKYGALKAEQTVDSAANGLEVGTGSAAALTHSTDLISDMDASLIHYNAARQAYGERMQSQAYKAAGRGALAKGMLGAGTSFLSGAQSLSDKWQAYQMSGTMKAGA